MVDKIVKTFRLRGSARQLPQPRYLIWSGYAVSIWSIAYMLPHLCWALGGTFGLSMLKPSISELPQWKTINWVASGFLTAAGFLGLAFIYVKKRSPLSWLLLAIALTGCSLATSHGIYGIINRILQIAGVAELESGPFSIKEHAYVVWDLVLFEPWFLIEGILLGLVGWHCLSKPRCRQIWLMLCMVGLAIGIVTALLGVRFA